jgi:uridine kinase
VCGGTASGKTSVCMRIQEEFQKDGKVVVWRKMRFIQKLGNTDSFFFSSQLLSQDCFYKNLTAEQKANASQYNFDHPDAIDWEYNEEVRI